MSETRGSERPDARATAAPIGGDAFALSDTPRCANCGAPLLGEFCYVCGQPVKGMVRHLASVLSDVGDTIFNVDSRIFRTLIPLYLRPGFLTDEYFLGRRTRYVTPFRLFFFLSVIAFFVMQFAIDLDDADFDFNFSADHAISTALSEADVRQREKSMIDALDSAIGRIRDNGANEQARDKIVAKETKVHAAADKRVAWLKARDEALAHGRPAPSDPAAEDATFSFDGTPWDPAAHPLKMAWLPAFANARLNAWALRVKGNVKAAQKDPRHALIGMISVLPQTLFVLMPLFALMLKIFYVFKRRLYMEHLIVALHSHAFIFLSLLLIVVLGFAKRAADANAAWLAVILDIASAAVWLWLPIYLLIMQKRVYRQGWIMTSLKYGAIGVGYTVIMAVAVSFAAIASLALT